MAILECKNLSIQFGGLKAVDSLDLRVNEGELYGLIGPNGAGKTTVFNLLTGIYKPTLGTIKLDGNLIGGKKAYEINRLGIARTFQNIRLFSKLSVIDNVKVALSSKVKYSLFSSFTHLFSYKKKEKEMDELALSLLELFDLASHKDEKAGSLPYGKQRKLEIARALATNPKLLILDEPAAGMNPNETSELMEVIKFIREKFKLTILLIEHDMKLVSGICDRITVLNFGKELISGEKELVLNDPTVISAYLGE